MTNTKLCRGDKVRLLLGKERVARVAWVGDTVFVPVTRFLGFIPSPVAGTWRLDDEGKTWVRDVEVDETLDVVQSKGSANSPRETVKSAPPQCDHSPPTEPGSVLGIDRSRGHCRCGQQAYLWRWGGPTVGFMWEKT